MGMSLLKALNLNVIVA